MQATILSLVALSVGVSGEPAKPAASVLIGTWRVQLSQEVKDVARKMGMPEPQAELVFNADSTFSYWSNSGGVKNSWSGKYEQHDSAVALNCSAANWPSEDSAVKLEGGSLTMNGLKFVHPSTAVSVVGTWTVHSVSGAEDRSIKMIFKSDGSFVFNSSNATSKGTYSTAANQVFLKWLEVDGEKVDFDMHKTLTLSEDGGCFMIDSYRYARQG